MPNIQASARHEDVDEIIAEYLMAQEAGEQPDPADYLKRYPQLAPELESFFANRDEFDRFSRPFRPSSASSSTKQGDPTVALAKRAWTTGDQPDSAKRIGNYEIVEELAHGGMGVVYKARQLNLNRVVALKMMLAGTLASEDEVRRFQREAEAVAGLDHPHIVPVYEVGEHEGRHYFSMKLIEGGNLASAISDGQLRMADFQKDAARILMQVARAVHHAHQRGILHRDLKPANILLEGIHHQSEISNLKSTIPMVTDFGLSRRLPQAGVQSPSSDAFVGTPGYFAPEQAAGPSQGATAQSDVYSLGAILYEMLTGKPPFTGTSILEIVRQVAEKEPQRPSTLNPDIDRDLETICLKCLQKQPEQRYASAEALADDLERWLAGEPVAARPIAPSEKLVRWCRRNKAISMLSGAVALALFGGVLGMALLFSQAVSDRQDADDARKVAIEERDAAEAARKREAELLREAREARERAETSLTYNRITLANQYREVNNTTKALQLLDLCPPERRNWEWHYLRRLCSGAAVRMPGYSFVTSQDGTRMLVSVNQDEVALWDVVAWRELRRFRYEGASDNSRAYTISGNGKRVALAGTRLQQHGSARVYDADSGQLVCTIGQLPKTYWWVDVELSPDGALLATVGAQGNVVQGGSCVAGLTVWEVATGKARYSMADAGSQVVFSADGRKLAVCAQKTQIMRGLPVPGIADGIDLQESSVRILNADTGKELRTITNADRHLHPVFRLSPDGKYLVAAGSQTALYDVETGKEVRVLEDHKGVPTCIAFSRDGTRLLTGGGALIKLYAVANGELLQTYRASASNLTSLAFMADDRHFVSAAGDGAIRLWNAMHGVGYEPVPGQTGNPEQDLFLWSSALSQDGSMLAGIAEPAALRMPPFAAPQTTVPRQNLFSVLSDIAMFSALSTAQCTLNLYDARTGKLLKSLGPIGRMTDGWAQGETHITFDATGTHLAVVLRNGSVQAWEIATGQVAYTLPGPTKYGVAFDPKGKRIAVGRTSNRGKGQLSVYDATTGKELLSCPLTTSTFIQQLWFSPDGKWLAGEMRGQWENTGGVMMQVASIQLFDAATGAARHLLTGHKEHIESVAFSPDGKQLATASWDQTARVYDTESGRELHCLLGHSGYVMGIAFTQDGRRLLTTGFDETLKIWDPITGEEVLTVSKVGGGFTRLWFGPDGLKLLGSGSRGARLWNANPL